jgi:hypothetical protein
MFTNNALQESKYGGIFDRLKENVVNFFLCILIFIQVYFRGINCQLDF